MHLDLSNCDLAGLSETILEAFLDHPLSGKGMGLRNALARSLHTCFQDEQFRRLKVRAGYETTPIRVTIPLMTDEEILEAAVAISLDCVQLERAAQEVEHSNPPRAASLRVAAELLCKIGMAVKSQADAHLAALERPPC